MQPDDLGEALRFLLRTSRSCLVCEIEFDPPGQDRRAPGSAWVGNDPGSVDLG